MSPLDIPDDHLNSVYEKTITPGVVVRYFDPRADKEKRVIVLGLDEEKVLVCYIRINSKLNTNIHKTAEQQSTQYLIKKEDYKTFIDHDSYADCNSLIECRLKDLIDYIKNVPDAILGNIDRDELDVITSIVIQAPTSIPKTLKKYDLL